MDSIFLKVIIHIHDTFNNLALQPLAPFSGVNSHLDPPYFLKFCYCYSLECRHSLSRLSPIQLTLLCSQFIGHQPCFPLFFLLGPILAFQASLSILCSWEGILKMLVLVPDITSHLVLYYKFTHTGPHSAAWVQPTIYICFL